MACRQILDEAFVAHEINNWAKRSKMEVVLMKLDFCKAYDIINGKFIDHVLELMGFGTTWRQ